METTYSLNETTLAELRRLRQAMDDYFDHNEPNGESITEYEAIEAEIAKREASEPA